MKSSTRARARGHCYTRFAWRYPTVASEPKRMEHYIETLCEDEASAAQAIASDGARVLLSRRLPGERWRFCAFASAARVLCDLSVDMILAPVVDASLIERWIGVGIVAIPFPFVDEVETGDQLNIDPWIGDVNNRTTGWAYSIERLPMPLRQVWESSRPLSKNPRELS